MSGTWDQRLVRLAVVQQIRAAYGIKVKRGRAQSDRRRQETATTEHTHTHTHKIKIPFALMDSFRYDFTQELAAS